MGTPQDMAFRKANPRIDDAARREEVTNAQEAIVGGLAVGGDPVLRFLSNSGAPVMVCNLQQPLVSSWC